MHLFNHDALLTATSSKDEYNASVVRRAIRINLYSINGASERRSDDIPGLVLRPTRRENELNSYRVTRHGLRKLDGPEIARTCERNACDS